MLNWKEATQRTSLLGRSPSIPTNRSPGNRLGSNAPPKSPRSRILVSRMLTWFISKQSRCSRYYIHRCSTTALLHHSILYCAPSLIIVLFFVVIFFFLFCELFFLYNLLGLAILLSPLLLLLLFSPSS